MTMTRKTIYRETPMTVTLWDNGKLKGAVRNVTTAYPGEHVLTHLLTDGQLKELRELVRKEIEDES